MADIVRRVPPMMSPCHAPFAYRLAYHEAGHVLVGHYFSRRVDTVTIMPGHSKGYRTDGLVRFASRDYAPNFASIVISAAGVAGESFAPVHVDDPTRGAEGDFQAIGIVLDLLEGDPKTIITDATREATRLLNSNLTALDHLATALLDRQALDGEEVEAILARYMQPGMPPRELVERYRPRSSPSQTRRIELPLQTRKAPLASGSVDVDRRTVTLTFTTGAAVRRRDYEGPFDEVLVVSKDALVLDRLNAGAPVLDSHSAYSTTAQIAVVERAWIEGGEGRATVRFPQAGIDKAADRLFGLIEDRIIKNVSVGYRIHRMKVIQPGSREQVRQHIAEKWEPYEISFVTVPADIGAQVRSTDETFACEVVTEPSLEAKKARLRMQGRMIEMELDHLDLRLKHLEANECK